MLDDYNNPALIETLTEHVGHLPIMATFFHPYLEHGSKVDLGKALTMLAIHDIGETVVGDVYSFKKDKEHDKKEYEAAIKILPEAQREIYEEYEGKESYEAKYANSIDKLAPLIGALRIPKITIEHALMHGVTIETVENEKREAFKWDSLMGEVFELCIGNYKDVRAGGCGIM